MYFHTMGEAPRAVLRGQDTAKTTKPSPGTISAMATGAHRPRTGQNPRIPESQTPRAWLRATKMMSPPIGPPDPGSGSRHSPHDIMCQDIGAAGARTGAHKRRVHKKEDMHVPSVLGILVGMGGGILFLQPPLNRHLFHWCRKSPNLISSLPDSVAALVAHDDTV